MPHYALTRLLDTYFRRPVLYVLPVVLFALVGGWYVASQEPEYSAYGVLNVEDATFLSTLTQVRGAEIGYNTPAGYYSAQFNSLLQTDAFVSKTLERAGLRLDAVERREMRSMLGALASGDKLMHVWANHNDPQTAQELSQALIDTMIQWEIDTEIAQSSAAEGFLSPLTERYRTEVEDAHRQLEDYLLANPPPEGGTRPGSQQVVIDSLTAEISDANARYADAIAKEESARLATAQAEADVRNRFQILDPPETPKAPRNGLRAMVVGWLVFVAVGGVISVGLIAAATLLDTTVRDPRDLERRLGLPVLAVLPTDPDIHSERSVDAEREMAQR